MTNRLTEVIAATGGKMAFASRMGGNKHHAAALLGDVAAGRQVPRPETRRRIVEASQGHITDDEIIAITGQAVSTTKPKYPVDEHWSLEEHELKTWVTTKAAKAAKKQRLANERAERAAGS